MLQWGRNFIVAETSMPKNGTAVASLLQWGRNFIVAETKSQDVTADLIQLGFNGAATLSLRRLQ